MNIVALADDNVNAFYRSMGPLRVLRRRGHEVTIIRHNQLSRSAALLAAADVLHVHRYCDDASHRFAVGAKEAGAVIVWDDDDDLAAVPRGNVRYRQLGGLQGTRRLAAMRRMFELADLVTAPNEILLKRFVDAGAEARATLVIENHVPEEFFVGTRPHDGVVVGWVAGLEHQADLERIPLLPALRRLLAERPQVRLVSIGLGFGLSDDRYQHIKPVQLGELPALLAGFDIGLAPLADIPFSRARSNIKLKEYGAVGLPWLASPVGPYRELGEKQGGRLVADDEWFEAIARLVDKERERRKLAKRANRWAQSQSLEATGAIWERMLGELLATRGALPA